MTYKNSRLDGKRNQITKRIELLAIVGGKCRRCGNDDWRVLEIDHVNGDGCAERASGMKHNTVAFRNVVLAEPHRFQCLCANCHRIKTLEDRWGGPMPEPITDEERATRRAAHFNAERMDRLREMRTSDSFRRIGAAQIGRDHSAQVRNETTGRFAK